MTEPLWLHDDYFSLWILDVNGKPAYAVSDLTIQYIRMGYEAFSATVERACGHPLPRDVWDMAKTGMTTGNAAETREDTT